MTPKTPLVMALALALVAVPAAWGGHAPDAFERAVSAHQRSTPLVSPDVVDRAVAAKLALESTPIVSPDAVDRVRAASLQEEPITSPDAFDRAFRQTDNQPIVPSTADSSRDLEWQQIGMGFGLGIVLVLGLFLTLRSPRIRQPAH